MDYNEDIIIYPKMGKLFVLSLVFVIVSAALVYFGMTEEDISMILVIAGVLGVVIFGMCLLYFASRLKNKQPSLIVNDEGITDQSSYIQAGAIPWHEIEGIELYTMANQRLIGIKLYHPEMFMSQQKGFKKLLMRANQGLVNTPINIAESGLPMSLETLYEIIVYKWEMYVKETPAVEEDEFYVK